MDAFKSNLKRNRITGLLESPQRKLGDSSSPAYYRYITSMVTKESVRLDLNYPPTPVGGIADFDEDAACRLDLKASTHFRGVEFSN